MMPQSKAKQNASRPESNPSRERAQGARVPAATRCEAALAKVLELAAVLAQDTQHTRGSLPSGRARKEKAAVSDVLEPAHATDASSSESPRDQLAAAFQELEPELALKLRTLMIAGRDGQSIGAVNVNLSLSDAEAGFAIMAGDSSENGPLLLEYLRRGHAMACAMGIDLDTPLSEWQSSSSPDLGERAWLSFGKQLATSEPADWQGLGIVEPNTRGFSKLYLRLGQHAWWSFQTVLDRPTPANVEQDRRALAKRRLKGVSAHSLEALVGQLGSAQGRALQRAGRAIRARVGHSTSANEP